MQNDVQVRIDQKRLKRLLSGFYRAPLYVSGLDSIPSPRGFPSAPRTVSSYGKDIGDTTTVAVWSMVTSHPSHSKGIRHLFSETSRSNASGSITSLIGGTNSREGTPSVSATAWVTATDTERGSSTFLVLVNEL